MYITSTVFQALNSDAVLERSSNLVIFNIMPRCKTTRYEHHFTILDALFYRYPYRQDFV